MLKDLLKYLPPPHFLSMPATGLAISDRAVRYLRLKRTGFGFAPVLYGSEAIPPGVIKDGDVVDAKVFTEILSKLRQKIGSHFVSVSIPEEKAYLFKTEIPEGAESFIRENLSLRLEEFVPMPARESVFDFVIKNQESFPVSGNNKKGGVVGVAVLPEKVASNFVSVLHGAGLVPLTLQIDAFAVCRSVVKKEDARTFLLVNLGKETTTLSVIGSGIVYFTTTYGVGGSAFTSAVEKYFGVSPAEAERLKEEGVFIKKKDNADLFASVANTLSVIRDEINRVLIYWKEHGSAETDNRKGSVDAVLLCGRDAAMNGLREYLSSSIKFPVETVNVWSNVCSFEDYIPPITFRDSLDFAAAVGLATLRPE